MSSESESGVVRLDRWLCAARLFQSRTQAQEACAGGHVKLAGATVRPSHVVRLGDRLEGLAPRGHFVVVVLGLAEKRQSPALARLLYEDQSPPPEPRQAPLFQRDRGTGRPTKADRRRLSKLRGLE